MAHLIYAITFNGNPKAKKNRYLYYSRVQMASDVGFIVPEAGTIIWATTNRGDTDDSDIEINVNDVVQDTLVVLDQNHVFVTSIAVIAGDLVSGFNKNMNDMDDFTMTLFIQYGTGIEEAPEDGTPYGREDATWVSVVAAPSGTQFPDLAVGDTVDVTIGTATLDAQEVKSIPDSNQVYWELEDTITAVITIVGPALTTMTKQ
jgi:hypothetical protein